MFDVIVLVRQLIARDHDLRSAVLGTLLQYGVVILLWNFRWLIVRPVTYLLKLSFSNEYKERRSIAGQYYLYHHPILYSSGDRIRMSMFTISVRTTSAWAQQSDWKKTQAVNYEGPLTFRKEFIYIEADAVVERYAGNRKYIILYRIYNHDRLTTAEATCGWMIGIANNSDIYRVPVLVTRFPLTHTDADQILTMLRRRGVSVAVKQDTRNAVATAHRADIHTVKSDFDSPFS